ncbi:methyl-accepting chemotaxis protein [Bdellovibrio sp. GT3]|uniref:methyl-accepting chemotaxis protein n=1 Tax=Bdellovibrio sp. GT3 TaxID=3136282 RepID=UPI0030F050F9
MSTIKKWLKGLRGKLLLLGVIPPVALFVIIYSAHQITTDLEGKIRYAYQVRVKLIEQVGVMSGSVHAMGRWMWIANGFADQTDQRDNFLSRAKNEIAVFDDVRDQYSKMPRNPEIIELFSSVEKNWAVAKDAAQRAIAEYEKGTPEGAAAGKAILASDFVKNLVPMTEAFKTIGQKMDIILTEEITATQKQVKQVKIFLWSLGLVVALFIFVMAISIAVRLVSSFSKVGQDIGGASKDTASASTQLSIASQSLSGGATTAAASLEETVSSLEELTSMVKRNAENAHAAEELSKSSRNAAEAGQTEILMMVNSMTELSQSSKKIEEIINVIDDIAFQTNLLALNAAVEAARAGEQGKGFAVVAEAVRTLAQRSAIAAKDISGLIKDNAVKTNQSALMAEKNGKMLKEIVDGVSKVTSLNQDIATASQEQSTGLSQISIAMNQLDKSIQENAASSEEVAASSEEMSAQAMQLSNMADILNVLIDGKTNMRGEDGVHLPHFRVERAR